MRRFILLASALVSVGLFASACEVGDGDFDGVGGFGGFGDGDGDGDAGGAGGEPGDGDGDGDETVPLALAAPEGFPVPIDYALEARTVGYSSDSPELRIRDAYRLARRELYSRFDENSECFESFGFVYGIVGKQGDTRLNIEESLYFDFCKLACLVENGTCDDADEETCEPGLGYSEGVQSCIDECGAFSCADGSGVDPERCDGQVDCDDLSDEEGCGDFSFVCKTVPEAVGPFFVCDGIEDCSDGSDEANCGTQGFVCDDGSRIGASEECDGVADCTEGEDEADCADLLFDCGDGTEIPWYQMCNGVGDCADQSDEVGGIVDCSSWNFDVCQ